MKLPDLLIIYLACGAPFGVYYYLQNRIRLEAKLLFFNSFLRFIFWIPYAIQLVVRNSFFTNLYNRSFDAKSISDASREKEIEEIKKYFEDIVGKRISSLSIYEFRETFDRYVGLSLEIHTETDDLSVIENEFYKISKHENQKLGEICLNRRNRQRLLFHQKLARRDFFRIFGLFIEKTSASIELFNKSIKLADMLNDLEARVRLESLLKEYLQTTEENTVSNLEHGIWKTETHKQLSDNKISTNLQVMTATANLSNKD